MGSSSQKMLPMTFSSDNAELQANIFYRILLDSIKNRFVLGNSIKKSKKGTLKLTQTHLFFDLNILSNASVTDLGSFDGLYYAGVLSGSSKNDASKFKFGKPAPKKSDIYKFNNNEIIRNFDFQIKNEYLPALAKAINLARRYFDYDNLSNNNAMIKAILFLILYDKSIDESQEFYICSDGSTKTKASLRNISEIEFEPFLLGVWHYLIVSRRLQKQLEKIDPIIVDTSREELTVKLKCIDPKIVEKTLLDSKSNPDKHDDNTKDNEIHPKHEEHSSAEVRTEVDSGSDLDARLRIRKLRKDNYPGSVVVADYYDEQAILDLPIDHEAEKAMYMAQVDDYLHDIDKNTDIIAIMRDSDITLSRSIFFYILLKCIQPVNLKRNKHAVEKLFLDLLNLTVDNDCEIDFEQCCVKEHVDKFTYLKELCAADCLDDVSRIKKFSDDMRKHYDDVLGDMTRISNKYFRSDSKNETLVVSLIEFIMSDDSIADDQEFIVCSDGSAMTKEQLAEIEEIEFEPFLLGVWHYVISQLTANDSTYEHTFNTVFLASYEYEGANYEICRSVELIAEKSEMYVELVYIED